MTTFQEFLRKKATELGEPGRRERVAEWVAAVNRLLEQIRAWLAESDPEGVLEVLPLRLQRSEPGLGTYDIAGLQIGVGREAAHVEPVGRNAIGTVRLCREDGTPAQGRVDISQGARKHILYRTVKDGQDHWFALDDRYEAAPLDRARLEAILLDLLS